MPLLTPAPFFPLVTTTRSSSQQPAASSPRGPKLPFNLGIVRRIVCRLAVPVAMPADERAFICDT